MNTNTTSNTRSEYQVPATFSDKAAWHKRVLADKNLSAGAKVAASGLMNFHNAESGQCNPRQSVLAEAIGMGRQRVNAIVAELEAAGWISVGRAKGSGSMYRLNVERQQSEARPSTPKRAQPTSKRLSPFSDRGCPAEATGVVAFPGQGVVAFSGHRTEQGNSLREQRREQPNPGHLSHQPENTPRSARPAEAGDGSVRVHTIKGLRLTEEQVAAWKAMFPSINVLSKISARAEWARKLPPDRQMKALETELRKFDEEAERERREAALRIEAEAKHTSAERLKWEMRKGQAAI